MNRRFLRVPFRSIACQPPYSQDNNLYKALADYDSIIRSIYTLNYFIDPTLHKNVHRSQNQVESYHQLRAAIAEAYGKKELIGKTDVEIEISNQCGRLIANAINYYDSAILSKLYLRFKSENNIKGIEMLKKISSIAYQHIHFHGHLSFSEYNIIDLDEIVKSLNIEL